MLNEALRGIYSLQEFFAALVCPRMTNEKKFIDYRLDNMQFDLLQEFVVQVSLHESKYTLFAVKRFFI